ncbi:hypothetical protein [Butyrivibrio sp. YAB3001]|uniref:hypothetical protein n=1 Tax=Butyrivibrio sp. YAB3001 TaxID=1520812 RepID=UPI0008F68560|nr:hypothetical protein [Butyrivibrio sp. YAB3001]SFC50461.1 hypothetical protein SAMN02910398_02433 [Butyrivibrio sp. YAB3001]
MSKDIFYDKDIREPLFEFLEDSFGKVRILDGDYGCEELQPGQKPKVSVTLVDDAGNEKLVSVEDDWLTENGLDVGSEWPAGV